MFIYNSLYIIYKCLTCPSILQIAVIPDPADCAVDAAALTLLQLLVFVQVLHLLNLLHLLDI